MLPDREGETPNCRVHAFYYPWYGNPKTDGRYDHWNHSVAVRKGPPRQFPGGDDIGASFYPALGCYSVVACDNGFYLSRTAGEQWAKLPLETQGTPAGVEFDSGNPHLLYAMTKRSIHRSLDYDEALIGMAWEDLGRQLPAGMDFSFKISPGVDSGPSAIHAIHGSSIFSNSGEADSKWQRTALGLGEYGESGNWLAVTAQNPGRLIFGVRFGGSGFAPMRTIFQKSHDGGKTWTNTSEQATKAFYEGRLGAFLNQFPQHDFRDVQFAPGSPSTLYALDAKGIVRVSSRDANWSPLISGLDIPRVDRLFCPAHGDRVYASTPAGIFHLTHGESQWQASHLMMQWRRNERRELGGAAFITAYWRGLYFGLLQEEAD